MGLGFGIYCVIQSYARDLTGLPQPNHLLSAPPIFLKVFFRNTADLQSVRRELLPLAQTNSAKFTAVDAYADVVGAEGIMPAFAGGEESEERAWGVEEETKQRRDREPSECIIDIREYDIAYYLRVAIDLGKISIWTFASR